MTTLPRLAFAALVAATIAAFFVTQRLKHEPAVLLGTPSKFLRPLSFSPDGNGYQDRLRIQFGLRRADDVAVSAVSTRTDDVVKHIAGSLHVKRYRTVVLHWYGTTDDGGRAPDGTYRIRVGLRREGRTVTLPGAVRVDRVSPPVKVTSRSAAIVKPGRPVTIDFRGTSLRKPKLLVIRTDIPRPRVLEVTDGKRRSRELRWDGLIGGKPAPVGTYLLGVETRDAAGNFGHYPATLPNATVVPGTGVRLPSHLPDAAGVTVREIALTPTTVGPVKAGGKIAFFVDARLSPYTWDVRRIGAAGIHSSGSGTRNKLTFSSPRGTSAVYVLEVRANGGLARLPFEVENRKPAQRRVLVVLPYLSWQARNALDDAPFDGVPDTLARGGPVPLVRALGLPAGFDRQEGPLLVFLDRNGLRYDLTTDAALALGQGPQLAGHTGVVLAGQPTWTTPALGAALRRYVAGGGKVLVAGTDALRRTASLASGARLMQPSPESYRDVFGLRYGPPRPLNAPLTTLTDAPLFQFTGGQFTGFTTYEPLLSKVVGYAGPRPGVHVIAQVQLGKGQVLRFGLPEWASKLADPAVATLTRQAWSILSR